MNISVIGSGYVGLVTGACFADMGNEVLCMDINEEKVRQLNSGRLPIYEPDLDPLLRRNVEAGRLRFTCSLEEAVRFGGVIFLALPTPEGEDGSADLRHVLGVANQIGGLLTRYTVIVTKSTVPVGTAEKVHEIISLHSRVEFDVVSNPEFLREGFAVEDFMRPDRVVIGTSSQRARRIMEQLYEPFVRQGNPIFFMDERSAELTKYVANSYLAMRISFMNDVANLCERLGCDVDQVRKGIGSDSRIGKRFLFAGVGYGGSCFPKDVKALVKTAADIGNPLSILEAVTRVNERQRVILIEKMTHYYAQRGWDALDWSGMKIAMWGIAFKPNTDDIREAPSIYIIRELLKRKCRVAVYDPEALTNLRRLMGDAVEYCQDIYSPLHNADALLIVTEWPLFRTVDFERVGSLMKERVIFDGRNLYNLEQVAEHNFYYNSIGRRTIVPTTVKKDVTAR